jgi:hypothetical protein
LNLVKQHIETAVIWVYLNIFFCFDM